MCNMSNTLTAATPALLLLRNIIPNASVAPGAVTSVFTHTPSLIREHLVLSKPCPQRYSPFPLFPPTPFLPPSLPPALPPFPLPNRNPLSSSSSALPSLPPSFPPSFPPTI